MNYGAAAVLQWGSPEVRGIPVRSFGSGNVSGALSVCFQVPADYAGPSAADLAACPGIQAPRMKIRWVTDSTQAATQRKIYLEVEFAPDTQLGPGNINRIRYNIRANSSGPDSAESLDPTSSEVASQSIPEAGEIWSVGEGPVPAWIPGQTIIITLYRNATLGDDPNNAKVGLLGVSFDYDAEQ